MPGLNDWSPELIYQVKGDFSPNVGDQLMDVTNALIKYFGGEYYVSFELYHNCSEGYEDRFFRIDEASAIDNNDFENHADGDFWSAIYAYDIGCLICISL